MALSPGYHNINIDLEVPTEAIGSNLEAKTRGSKALKVGPIQLGGDGNVVIQSICGLRPNSVSMFRSKRMKKMTKACFLNKQENESEFTIYSCIILRLGTFLVRGRF